MSRAKVDIALTLDIDQPFNIVSCDVTEGISEITHARLEVSARDDLDLEDALTGDAAVHIYFDGAERRRFTLKVGRIAFLGIKMGSFRYAIDLYAHLWLLRFTNNTRKFRKISAKDIVSKVLGECGVAFEWKTTRETPRRNYCVQYHETNLEFVERLLEFEGIYYTFDDAGTLVLADRSEASSEIDGVTSHFELMENAGALERDERGIFEICRGAAVASGAVTVNDFDWKKPHAPLIQGAKSDRDSELEVYEYPAGYRNVKDGAYLAKIRLEAHRVAASYVEGKGDVPEFAAGRVMSVGVTAGDLFAGDYLLTRVAHTLTVPGYDEDGKTATAYENSFRAIEKSTPFRPAIRVPRPTIAGFHTAMVRGPTGEEIHTDQYGRFRAQFHWDREAVGTDDDSRWVRILQETATSMSLARVGWEMSMGYIDGDPDRPIGLARHINGEMVPNYMQPANQSMMTIKTPTYPGKAGFNEWRMDDRAGSMSMDIRAELDMITKVLHDRSERVGSNVTHTCKAAWENTVGRDQSLTVGGDAKTAVDVAMSLAVNNDRSITVSGDETIQVAQEQVSSVAGNETETVGSVRLTVSGGFSFSLPTAKSLVDGMKTTAKASLGPCDWLSAPTFSAGAPGGSMGADGSPSLSQMLPKAPTSVAEAANMAMGGSIDRTAKTNMTRMVGGAYIAIAGDNVDTLAGKSFVEAIGGAKITVTQKGSIGQTVGGPHSVTVGGAVIRTAEEDMSYSANKSDVKVGGVAGFTSDERIELRGDSILIEAATDLSLVNGGVAIGMGPGEIKMKGKVKLDCANKIVITGGPDNLT